MSRRALIANGSAVTVKATSEKPKPRSDNVPRLEYWPIEQLHEHGNPLNWRAHPESQAKALQALMAKAGWAGAFVFNERTKRIIDGHLRLKITRPKTSVPVFIVDLPEDKEHLALATFDLLGQHSIADSVAYRSLCDEVAREFGKLGQEISGLFSNVDPQLDSQQIAEQQRPGCWVEITFRTRRELKQTNDELTSEGFECRF